MKSNQFPLTANCTVTCKDPSIAGQGVAVCTDDKNSDAFGEWKWTNDRPECKYTWLLTIYLYIHNRERDEQIHRFYARFDRAQAYQMYGVV